jgi:hypothetical protein
MVRMVSDGEASKIPRWRVRRCDYRALIHVSLRLITTLWGWAYLEGALEGDSERP